MIDFADVTHYVRAGPAKKIRALSAVTLSIPSNRRIALLGDSDQNNRAVIDLVTGAISPTKGSVRRRCRVSYVAGDIRAFAPELSVRGNIAYVARLYGADARTLVKFIRDDCKMKRLMDEPFGALPPGIKRQISQITAFCLPFDVYVLASALGAGSNHLRSMLDLMFEARSRDYGVITTSRNPRFIQSYCDTGLLLHNGQLTLYPQVDDALDELRRIRRQQW